MSKYTLSIYEWSVGMIGNENATLDNVKQIAKSLVFNKDFNFYNDSVNDKNEFINKFINKYLYEEMGLETPALWRDRVYTRLNIKMPYYKNLYNSLINSLEELQIVNSDTTTRNKTNTDKIDETNTNTSKTDSSVNVTSSNNNVTNNSNSGTSNTNNNSQNLRSDEPQSTITSNAYASLLERNENITNVNNSENSKSDSTDSGKSDSASAISRNETSNKAENRNGSESEVVTKEFTGSNKTEMYKAYREMILNIDELLLSEFEGLFMQIF
nr:MAG TPA_asm: Lower collar protein [Caudoviricetes sp.]